MLTCLLLGGGGRGQEVTPSHVPHTRGVSCEVAESVLFQRDAYVSKAGVGTEKRFKQGELPSHLGCEGALASSNLAPPLSGTRRRFVSLGQEERFQGSSKRENEVVEG